MPAGPEPLRVLVVEDEFITGSDIRSSLLEMGYDVPRVVDNGPDAVRAAGEMRPDVVLMDITLSGEMDGIAAAGRIRSDYNIPVIFLTAHSDDATFEKARITEPFGYIIKPFEPRSLRISIEMARYKHAIDDQLRKSEERYRGFVQNFLGIAYRRMPDLSPVFMHGAIRAMTGYSEQEFTGGAVRWESLLHPEDAAGVLETNRAVAGGGERSLTREYRILDKEGNVRWIHELMQFVDNRKGDPPYIQGACYDITERKNAEDAIRLANRKLNLLNNITRHDILNSVHGLLGLLEMAKDTVQDEEVRQLLGDMEVSAGQIQRQITFTRNYQDVGVKAPVWQGVLRCIGQAHQALNHGPVTVVTAIDEDVAIYADPLLEKVFYNLIDNALRYGETITTIRFSCENRGGSLVIFCEDDGAGIPKGEKDSIFEQCVGRNTGMGLFLSREILMITGITICECGMPGRGARFGIVVPPGAWRRGSAV